MQTMGSKKFDLRVFSRIFFTCGQLSHKQIYHNLRQCKESLIEVLLGFI